MEIGKSYTVETVVDQTNTAAAMGSGTLDVFATPAMIAQMELAACTLLSEMLEASQSSVGTKIDVSHSSATPVGMKIYATAKITAVDRRRVDFEVSASDEAGEIGVGTHTRFIVDIDKFMGKAAQKKAE
ncbi:MAG: thioesterase family protein [Christensenellaceae bacterium]|jgi:fluoroacetyl-CoA thioesterase